MIANGLTRTDSVGTLLSNEEIKAELKILEEGYLVLMDAETVEDYKNVRDKAEMLRRHFRTAKAGLFVQNAIAELKLRAERAAGRLLANMAMHGGDRKSGNVTVGLTLKELGISRNQSSRWQKMATVSEEVFCVFMKKTREAGQEITSASLLRIASNQDRNSSSGATDVNLTVEEINNLKSPREIVTELVNHLHVFESILAPVCECERPCGLESCEREHIGRLLREFQRLFEKLQHLTDGEESAGEEGVAPLRAREVNRTPT